VALLDDVVEFLAWSDDVEACADDTNDPDGDDVGTDAGGGLAFCLPAAAVTSVLAGLLGAAAAKGMTLATDDFFYAFATDSLAAYPCTRTALSGAGTASDGP